jgi:hypothetical protein
MPALLSARTSSSVLISFATCSASPNPPSSLAIEPRRPSKNTSPTRSSRRSSRATATMRASSSSTARSGRSTTNARSACRSGTRARSCGWADAVNLPPVCPAACCCVLTKLLHRCWGDSRTRSFSQTWLARLPLLISLSAPAGAVVSSIAREGLIGACIASTNTQEELI